ncbi:MAG: hypothetical protein KUG79_17460 [Pseudomonadales bacterium]|nr:hypothetical protein [Pseudomonadales bacterium]
MNIKPFFAGILLILLALETSGAEPRAEIEPPRTPLDLQFHEVKLGGFERLKLSHDLKIRGWQFGSAYVGQTKIADHWGLGFVVTRGRTIYGMNHRGIQVLRKF